MSGAPLEAETIPPPQVPSRGRLRLGRTQQKSVEPAPNKDKTSELGDFADYFPLAKAQCRLCSIHVLTFHAFHKTHTSRRTTSRRPQGKTTTSRRQIPHHGHLPLHCTCLKGEGSQGKSRRAKLVFQSKTSFKIQLKTSQPRLPSPRVKVIPSVRLKLPQWIS